MIVGAGFAGCVMAERLATQLGNRVLVCDKRSHIGGIAYDEHDASGILIHRYAPQVFHTRSARVFNYLSKFTKWRPYAHRELVHEGGKLLPFPVNVDTVNGLYGSHMTPDELRAYFSSQAVVVHSPRTAEEAIVSKVGRDLYEDLLRPHARKQWGADPSELDKDAAPPVTARADADGRCFTDEFQAMPEAGYARLFENMLDRPNISVVLDTDYRDILRSVKFHRMVYSGPLDAYFDYRFGELPHRSFELRVETYDTETFQPGAIIHYPKSHAFTRTVEFKYLTGQRHAKTAVGYELPVENGGAPGYPILRHENVAAHRRYAALAQATPNVSFVGRLAGYRYMDMDQVTLQALEACDAIVRQAKPSIELGRAA